MKDATNAEVGQFRKVVNRELPETAREWLEQARRELERGEREQPYG